MEFYIFYWGLFYYVSRSLKTANMAAMINHIQPVDSKTRIKIRSLINQYKNALCVFKFLYEEYKMCLTLDSWNKFVLSPDCKKLGMTLTKFREAVLL